MSQPLFIYIRADIHGPPEKVKDYLAWLELGTKLSTDGIYFIHTSKTKADFLEWIHNIAAITPT